MRQKGDDILIDILSRLREGVCTQADKDILDTYVLSDERCTEETKAHTSIQHWIDGKGCPLITYKNQPRDVHNVQMAKAFCRATGQEIAMYHSINTRGRGKK